MSEKIPRPRGKPIQVVPGPEELAAKLYIELYTSPSPARRRELVRLITEADDGVTFVVEQIQKGMLRP